MRPSAPAPQRDKTGARGQTLASNRAHSRLPPIPSCSLPPAQPPPPLLLQLVHHRRPSPSSTSAPPPPDGGKEKRKRRRRGGDRRRPLSSLLFIPAHLLLLPLPLSAAGGDDTVAAHARRSTYSGTPLLSLPARRRRPCTPAPGCDHAVEFLDGLGFQKLPRRTGPGVGPSTAARGGATEVNTNSRYGKCSQTLDYFSLGLGRCFIGFHGVEDLISGVGFGGAPWCRRFLVFLTEVVAAVEHGAAAVDHGAPYPSRHVHCLVVRPQQLGLEIFSAWRYR